MKERSFDEMIAYFNRRVTSMDINKDYKMELLGMVTALGVKHKKSAQPEIIQCKDCKWWGYDDDDGAVRVCHAAKHGHMSSNWSIMIYRTYKEDFYCGHAERRTDAES